MKRKWLLIIFCVAMLATSCNKNEVVEELAEEVPVEEVAEQKTLFCAEPYEISERFINLRNEYNNDDMVAYIKIDGTSVDYPVFQSDDNDFYLHRDPNKNESLEGSLFLDFKNDITYGNRQYIVYGHNMKEDTMFHSIRYYADEQYYKEHPYIQFDTLYHDYVFEVLTFYTADINEHYYIHADWPVDEAFEQYLDKIMAYADYDTGLSVTTEDVLLTLSTCTNVSDDTRFVLTAKLISIDGEEVTEGAARTPEA